MRASVALRREQVAAVVSELVKIVGVAGSVAQQRRQDRALVKEDRVEKEKRDRHKDCGDDRFADGDGGPDRRQVGHDRQPPLRGSPPRLKGGRRVSFLTPGSARTPRLPVSTVETVASGGGASRSQW